MGVGAGLYMCDVVKKFTFAISSPDEFLFLMWTAPEHNVAWTKAHLHAKCHLDISTRLATIDVGRKLGAVPLFGEEG